MEGIETFMVVGGGRGWGPGLPGGLMVKNLHVSAGDTGSIPGPGRARMWQGN